ncbi:hypothetical protein ACFOLF_21120 [Paenibacillus sepulcri]|uniref:Uncharacterized protein n=1 Tax=Paenibacillus sepulcri TaxID=359917 RepID=A0ABS7C751_9BACL|nr:hypothetical protein [Paenibacillus sepulcri]
MIRKRLMLFILLAAFIAAVFLSPPRHEATAHLDNSPQFEWAMDTYSNGAIEAPAVKNVLPLLPTIPFMIMMMVLFAVFALRIGLKSHIRSAVPILRLLYILNPIKFKSNYLASIPVLL